MNITTRKRRLGSAIAAIAIAAGALGAPTGAVSAATSNPVTTCEYNDHYNFHLSRWERARSVYFDPQIKVDFNFDGAYRSERVSYRAWLARHDGTRWVYYGNLSVSGAVDFQSGDFPRAKSVSHAGWYNWYVEYWYYPIGSDRAQYFTSWSTNSCFLQ